MLITVNNEEFDLNTKLGATFKIEEKFKKPYLSIIGNIDNLSAKEQINLVACGLNKEDENRFKEAISESGIGGLMDVLEQFIDGLQYPGLTSEEIEQKKLEKIAKQKHLKEIGLMN